MKNPRPKSRPIGFTKTGIFIASGLVVVTVLITGTLFALGVFSTSDDGATTDGHVHILTPQEKSQIAVALDSDNENRPTIVVYPCINNVQDKCYNVPNEAYYPTGFYTNYLLKSYSPTDSTTLKQIYGSLVSFSGAKAVIKTTSGRLFTITFPATAANNFKAADNYDYDVTASNNWLLVNYSENPDEHSTSLQPYQLLGVTISNARMP